MHVVTTNIYLKKNCEDGTHIHESNAFWVMQFPLAFHVVQIRFGILEENERHSVFVIKLQWLWSAESSGKCSPVTVLRGVVSVFWRTAPPVILHERKTSTTSTYEQNKRTKGLLTKG